MKNLLQCRRPWFDSCVGKFLSRRDRLPIPVFLDFPVTQLVKNPPVMQEICVWSLDWEDALEKGKAAHSSSLAWRIPWTVTGSQRVRHDWVTFIFKGSYVKYIRWIFFYFLILIYFYWSKVSLQCQFLQYSKENQLYMHTFISTLFYISFLY